MSELIFIYFSIPKIKSAVENSKVHVLSYTPAKQGANIVRCWIIHNKAPGQYSRKYKPIEINNAIYPKIRNFAVNLAVFFVPSQEIYNL